MLLFAHTGFTLGAAAVAAAVRSSIQSRRNPAYLPPARDTEELHDKRRSISIRSALRTCGDLRYLLLGSLLPDIIDKPIGILIFGNGRIVCHSLLFLAVLAIAAVFVWKKYNSTWLLLVAAGTLSHHILDEMWRNPYTLLWPLFGWAFPCETGGEWLSDILYVLLHVPSVYITEISGFIILALFVLMLLKNKKLMAFIFHGEF